MNSPTFVKWKLFASNALSLLSVSKAVSAQDVYNRGIVALAVIIIELACFVRARKIVKRMQFCRLFTDESCGVSGPVVSLSPRLLRCHPSPQRWSPLRPRPWCRTCKRSESFFSYQASNDVMRFINHRVRMIWLTIWRPLSAINRISLLDHNSKTR